MNAPVFQRFTVLILSMVVFMTSASAGEVRTWKSTDGRELVGEFVKAEGDTVTVRRTGGRTVSIPLAMLDAEDQKFVTERKVTLAAEAQAAAEKEAAKKRRKGSISYKLSEGSDKWPEDRKKAIIAAMDAGVDLYNKIARIRKEITANNSPGTPTADANYDGWINWGGTISRRVALHEISHTLGIGTHSNWHKNIKDGVWIGKNATALVKEFDGKDAVIHADRMHFWPYGLNFDNESNETNDVRHVRMVEAMRKDMDIR